MAAVMEVGFLRQNVFIFVRVFLEVQRYTDDLIRSVIWYLRPFPYIQEVSLLQSL